MLKKLNNQVDASGRLLSLKLSKGYITTSLARPFVDFITQKLNLNKMIYASDEMVFQTLTASDDLNAPNAFTHKCIERKVNIPYLTREISLLSLPLFTYWPEDETSLKCHSGYIRNALCVFGMEDLSNNFRNNTQIFANKILSSFDFGAVLCWHEEMRIRTFIEKGLNRLNNSLYQNWPQANSFS
ncbi:hypothetical protein Mgra_00006965 [Meloidogyne graminicola]|uniref:Uncharacterized protein n=1 Tax=Meloidogyne graminicola TaxID=189291 RepID=A0A8S9ZJX7_9BILA|nr:hypothetical protein Mgra_00006965 [Meloidogyne graminicola]